MTTTMSEPFPIVLPLKLVQEWIDIDEGGPDVISRIATRAAQWGADQELEACCAWIPELTPWDAEKLRAARRPKPPSLKELAQTELDRLIALIPFEGALAMAEPIRRALEALPE